MEKGKKSLIIGTVIIIVIAIAVILLQLPRNSSTSTGNNALSSRNNTNPAPEAGAPEVKIDIETPGTDTKPTIKDVAIPDIVFKSKGAVEGRAFRLFRINAEKNSYTPSIIVVNHLDTVDIKLTAVDNDYDFFMPSNNVYKLVSKGEEESIQFQAVDIGQHEFYCRDACSKEVKGVLVVNPREE